MTTETQILQELVEAVSRPDWWAIGITAVNAVIMAWLAWRQVRLQRQQTKLQEQQIRQQEYAIYSQLYKLVRSSNIEINNFLDNVHKSFWGRYFHRADKGYLKEKKDYIDGLLNELEQNAINFEIKFSKDFFNIQDYRTALKRMSVILQLLNEFVEKDLIYIDMNCNITMECIEDNWDKTYAIYISEHIKDEKLRPFIYTHILGFVEDRDRVFATNQDILEKIRERCKVE